MVKVLNVNGRFLCRPVTGVERVGVELLKAIEQYASEAAGTGTAINIFTPNSDLWSYQPNNLTRGSLKGIAWEHTELPLSAKNGWLLSPCNTGPIWHKRQIVIIHDAQPFVNPTAYSMLFRTWYRFLLPKLAQRAAKVVTVSHHSRSELEAQGIIQAGKAKVIYNGSDHIETVNPNFSILERNELVGRPFFLALGSLSPHKNLKLLLEVRARFPDTFPELVIAGGGNSKVFKDAGIHQAPGVKLLGRVTDEELRALYQTALAFLFPSLNEGFGIPPLEAMRCGCPVLATNAGAVPEVCGDAAILLDPLDADAWTRAMREIVSDEQMRVRCRTAGIKHASPFTWDRAAKELIAML